MFQQMIGIPMSTNCIPLLTDLFLLSYTADFNQGILKNKDLKIRHFLIYSKRSIENNRHHGHFLYILIIQMILVSKKNDNILNV